MRETGKGSVRAGAPGPLGRLAARSRALTWQSDLLTRPRSSLRGAAKSHHQRSGAPSCSQPLLLYQVDEMLMINVGTDEGLLRAPWRSSVPVSAHPSVSQTSPNSSRGRGLGPEAKRRPALHRSRDPGGRCRTENLTGGGTVESVLRSPFQHRSREQLMKTLFSLSNTHALKSHFPSKGLVLNRILRTTYGLSHVQR